MKRNHLSIMWGAICLSLLLSGFSFYNMMKWKSIAKGLVVVEKINIEREKDIEDWRASVDKRFHAVYKMDARQVEFLNLLNSEKKYHAEILDRMKHVLVNHSQWIGHFRGKKMQY